MKLTEQLEQSQLIKEYQSNKRLQWMIVGIAAILVLSLLKQMSVLLQEQRIETKSQLQHLAKLTKTANQTFDANLMQSLQNNVEVTIDNFAPVASASTAEAQALQDIDKKIGQFIQRKRLNLLGSDQVRAGNHLFWSVRIEIAGQLAEVDFIKVLKFFDANQLDARIASMQYSPKTSNSISLVADLIYIGGNHD